MNDFLKHHFDKWDDVDGCFVWNASVRGREPSYPQATWRGKQSYGHRYSYEEEYGCIPDGMIVRHKCDNTLCVNPMHLCIGTHQQNMEDMRLRKRSNTGERHHNSKITEKDVVAIREMRKMGQSYSTIAKKFNIGELQVGKIIRMERWGHV